MLPLCDEGGSAFSRFFDFTYISACNKCLFACTGNHHSDNIVVILKFIEYLRNILHHTVVQCIERFLPVDCDISNRAFLFTYYILSYMLSLQIPSNPALSLGYISPHGSYFENLSHEYFLSRNFFAGRYPLRSCEE